ncbi:MAG TPA: hypothetical protein VKM55_15635 [Candidatus Lokiarchaeia archaeon]|nr:hypothetical protein [Candidatus Lokiarchaeia archaeon]
MSDNGRVFDFTPFQDHVFPKWLARFKAGQGIGDFSFNPRAKKVDSYGTTDMLICEYTLNELSDLLDEDKDAWAATINQFQDTKTGKFTKTRTLHFWEHTTAYCTCALRLIDRKPAHPMRWKDDIIKDEKSMLAWTRQWRRAPWSIIWSGSHVWSGIPATLAMTGEGNDAFFTWYFDWFDAHVDPSSGFWRRGSLHKLRLFLRPNANDLFGAFHMYYVYEYMGKQWKCPENVVDWTLKLQLDNGLWGNTPEPYCRDLDGIYALTRSSRNAGGYRHEDVYEAVKRFLTTAEHALNDEAFVTRYYKNSHHLPGALTAVAECQKFFPDLVKTPKPWIQTLDKACYI